MTGCARGVSDRAGGLCRVPVPVYSSQQFVCDFGFLDGRLTADETAVSDEIVLDATLHGQQGQARPCRVGELRPNVLAKVIDRRLAV